MERFAFKIDAALRANLYKICRLCGIDNPNKVPILVDQEDDEPSLVQKVYELVGFMVAKNDKMPQSMCSICVDKINDFYEFREMTYATNRQTRKLLGLKQADPEIIFDANSLVKSEPLPIAAVGNKRGRKRKSDDVAGGSTKGNPCPNSLKKEFDQPLTMRKKQRLQMTKTDKIEIKDEPLDDINTNDDATKSVGKKGRKTQCTVCTEKFLNKEQADKHRKQVHVPDIPRYICNACNQTHHNSNDIKSHQLWHKLSKTPYKCPLCEELIPNNYAFGRHVREHTVPTPVELQVFDRECPLCKKTFVTNFFYNTHPCAIGTRMCGGCSRPLVGVAAYKRHAPYCPKIYLNHSKHILPEAVANEATMRIKNEYDAEEVVDGAPASKPENNMQPVVVLERLGSPFIRNCTAATQETNSTPPKNKNSERVSSKKYLKRVDQLLKNTINTLVSIKHEPEVQIDDTGPPDGAVSDTESDNGLSGCVNDFHGANDTSDSEGENNTTNATYNVADVPIKREPKDPTIEEEPADGMQSKQEPKTFALKLKITKNHGQLNSSLVDDNDIDASPSKSGKKKKKRKHKERSSAERDKSSDQNEIAGNTIVNIKQERLDECPHAELEASVMTSIPRASYDTNDQVEPEPETEPMDVKPNRQELDRLMQISHVASGVDIAEEAVEAAPVESNPESLPTCETSDKTILSKPTARKSTGGESTKKNSPQKTGESGSVAESTLPKIVSVQCGATVTFEAPLDVIIKPEPCNRGYADEMEEEDPDKTYPDAGVTEINHNEKLDDEAAYISGLDLSNIQIKQEKDLDLMDGGHMSDMEAAEPHHNGVENEEGTGGTNETYYDDVDDDADDSASSADEAEENIDIYDEERATRVYRELELPPLEPMCNEPEPPTPLIPSEPPAPPPLSLVISNVCSEVEMPIEKGASGVGEASIIDAEPISAPKENSEIEAQPFTDEPNAPPSMDSDEEQQNVLNHELSEQQIQPTPVAPTTSNCSTAIETTTGDGEQESFENGERQNEEAENRINEQQQEQERVVHHQVCPIDDANINEIAENNNNANIERELQDDANAAAAAAAQEIHNA